VADMDFAAPPAVTEALIGVTLVPLLSGLFG
jgi:bifunctional pyridoxal-dependent enzyme with beta-cystathionase and maltose regulon repressor activities